MSVLIREVSEDEAKNKNCALSNKRVLGSIIVEEDDMNQDTLFSATGISLIKCPVKNSEFKSKRFYRFLDKFEVELVNKLKVSSSLEGSKDTLSNVAVQVAMTKVAYDMADYSDKIKKVLDRDFGNHPYDIHQIITRSTILSDLCKSSSYMSIAEHIIIRYLKNLEYDNVFLSVAKEDFEKCVINYLVEKCVNLHDNDKFMTTYHNYIPDFVEANFFLKNYFDMVYNDILTLISMYNRSKFEDIIEQLTIDARKEYVEEHKKNIELNNTLKEERDKAKDFLPTLVRLKKEAEVGTEKQREIFDACIVEKNREIKRLEKQIKTLTDKLEKLTVDEEDLKELQEIITEQNYEFDNTLKYTFVIYENPDLEAQIKENIPNAIFVHSSEEFKSTSEDLVILMTKYIKHNMYYKIKDTCKIKNIPFMHCSVSNIEYIKSEIAKFVSTKNN